jgi:hypothetical protein
MIRVIQSANRDPNTTESRPPTIAPGFSDSGRPVVRASRQTTARLRATEASTARDRRRWRKICGYSTSSSEKKTGWRPARTNQSPTRPSR